MQYEYEEILVEFCDSARPSWSRRQGADTVPHVVLWWHGSCLRELRYPQKARQHLDIYTKSLTWTLDYVYIDMAMQHARTHATYIYVHIYTYITHPFTTHDTTYAHMFLNLCWPSFWSLPHDKASSSHLLRPRARKNDDIFLEIIILHVHTRRHSSKFASYIYMDGFSCIDAYWWSVA